MPIVKNSFERHKVLDRCFRDKSKKILHGRLGTDCK